jgi:DNA-nicking Smr family endonuclease
MIFRPPQTPPVSPSEDVTQWQEAIRDVKPLRSIVSPLFSETKIVDKNTIKRKDSAFCHPTTKMKCYNELPLLPVDNDSEICAPVLSPASHVRVPFAVDTRLRHYSTTHDTRTPHIEENILRRIRLGRIEVERTIDLHGMTQEAAHSVLCSFVMQASRDACRLVLVITGKGSVTTQGVLRHAVPRWCREATLAPLVIALHRAHSHHGGDGAYYIRVRKDAG